MEKLENQIKGKKFYVNGKVVGYWEHNYSNGNISYKGKKNTPNKTI